ncbi:MAG: hypothetical protein V7641_1067 [Blastocatellia bacterium]
MKRVKPESTMKQDGEMRAEYDFSKGVRGKYAGRIKPGDTEPRNCKVRVTMYLDADIVEHFKQKAGEPDGAGYQTQINNALRSVVEQPGNEAGKINSKPRFKAS